MLNKIEAVLRRAGDILLSAENIHTEEKSGRADLVTQFDKASDSIKQGAPKSGMALITNL